MSQADIVGLMLLGIGGFITFIVLFSFKIFVGWMKREEGQRLTQEEAEKIVPEVWTEE